MGSLEINVSGTNPADYFGFGTWEQIAKGQALVGVNPNDSDFQIAMKTGGSKTHSHSQGNTGSYSGTSGSYSGTTGSHKLTVDEMPSHTHSVKFDQSENHGTQWLKTGGNSGGPYGSAEYVYATGGNAGHTHTIPSHTHSIPSHTHTNPNTNSSSNVMPYYTVYVWRRTA